MIIISCPKQTTYEPVEIKDENHYPQKTSPEDYRENNFKPLSVAQSVSKTGHGLEYRCFGI